MERLLEDQLAVNSYGRPHLGGTPAGRSVGSESCGRRHLGRTPAGHDLNACFQLVCVFLLLRVYADEEHVHVRLGEAMAAAAGIADVARLKIVFA